MREQAVDDRVGIDALGLGVKVREHAVAQDRFGERLDVLDRHVIPAMHQRACLGATDERLRRAEAGTVWTNTWMDGFPEVAFGGFKQSGQGRENGRYGLEEFLEIKSVVMRIGQTRPNWVRD